MKIRIYEDEYFPYYSITKDKYDPEATITKKQLKTVLEAEKILKKAQRILERLYRKSV